MCPTLARLDAASYLAHWFRSPEAGFEYFRGRANAPAKLEGVRLHPVPFRKFRGDAAELFDFPLRKGVYPAEIGFSCPGAGKKNRGIFGPNIVPLRRNSEQHNFTVWRHFIQADSVPMRAIYRSCIQWFTGCFARWQFDGFRRRAAGEKGPRTGLKERAKSESPVYVQGRSGET